MVCRTLLACGRMVILVLQLSGCCATFLRRPKPDVLSKCSQPLGMSGGAIANIDIFANVYYTAANCGTPDGRLFSKYWCTYGSTWPKFYEVDFKFVTIVTGIQVRYARNQQKGIYVAYAQGDHDLTDFEFMEEEEIVMELPISTSDMTHWFKPVKARVLRLFPTTDGDQDFYNDNIELWGQFQFEFYGCPYWDYAKPLGMSSGMINDSKITASTSGQKMSVPLNARFGAETGYWNYIDGVSYTQTNININKYWLQVVLSTLKKIIYVCVEGKYAGWSQSYWVKYGIDEVSLLEYEHFITPPLNTQSNSTHIFSYPLLAKVFQYIPSIHDLAYPPAIRLELYGVEVLTPDHNWKLYNPYAFLDQIQFQDLRESNRIARDEYFATVKSMEVSDLLRTEELSNQDCLLNPSNCQEGLSLSFHANGDIGIFGHGDNVSVTDVFQLQSAACKSIEDAPIHYNDTFAIYIESFTVTSSHTIYPKIILEGTPDDSSVEFEAYVYINQLVNFASTCQYVNTSLHHLYGASTQLSYGIIDVGALLNTAVKSNAWKMGRSMSIILKPITASNGYIRQNTNLILSPGMITRCSSYESDIIQQLSDDKITQNNPDNCDTKPENIKFLNGHPGFVLCTNLSDYVMVNMGKSYRITAFKVAGSSETNLMLRDKMIKFRIAYTNDLDEWVFMKVNSNDIVFQRKEMTNSKVEVIPIPYPINARYIRIYPVPGGYIGSRHKFKFDVITCAIAPAKPPSWIKLNTLPICFGAKSETPGMLHLKTDVDISFIKLVHVNGGVRCKKNVPFSNWGCNDNSIRVVVTNEEKEIIAPPGVAASQGAYALPFYSSSSDEIQFSMLAPQFFRRGEKLWLWYLEDLRNSTEGDNNGTSCTDIYGWGKTHQHRWLATTNHFCVMIDSDNLLKLSSKCDHSFFLTMEMHLVHADTGKCVKPSCEQVSCNLHLSNTCGVDTKFVVDVNKKGSVKHIASGFYLAFASLPTAELELVLLASEVNAPIQFMDSLGFNQDGADSTYYENMYYLSKTPQGVGKAKTDCESRNSHLLSIRTKLEADVLQNFLKKHSLTSQIIIIGLENLGSDKYRWHDGSPFDYIAFDLVPHQFNKQPTVYFYWRYGKLYNANNPGVRRYICKKNHIITNDLPTEIPIVSSGLQSIDDYQIGQGFHLSARILNSHTFMSAKLSSGEVSCSAVFETTPGWKAYGMTWLKNENLLKVYQNGENIATGTCFDTSIFVMTKIKAVPSMFNFINIAGFYDHLYAYFRLQIADIKVWRHSLTDAQFVELHTQDEDTFSEYYTDYQNGRNLKIRSSVCSRNAENSGPCEDVDALLRISEDIDCEWIDGIPVSASSTTIQFVNHKRDCVYKCFLESNKEDSINGVSYKDDTCYCIRDMYDVLESLDGQLSCYLPVKVKYGPQTIPKAIKNVKIHPVNKMWYGVGDDGFVYRHPARTSTNADLWTRVNDEAKLSIEYIKFYDKRLWVASSRHHYFWDGKIFVYYNGSVADFVDVPDYHFVIGFNDKDIHVLDRSVFENYVRIHNGTYNFLEYDSWNKRLLTCSNDGYVSTVPIEKYSEISATLIECLGALQLAVSKHGKIYLNHGDVIKQQELDGTVFVIGPSGAINFKYFDVIDDDYFVALDANGVIHQYPNSVVSVPGLYLQPKNNFFDAQDVCEKIMGKVAEMHNDHDVALLRTTTMYCASGPLVGLQKFDNIFKYPNQKSTTYKPWCSGEEVTNSSDCAAISLLKDCFNPVYCHSPSQYYACAAERIYLYTSTQYKAAKTVVFDGGNCNIHSDFLSIASFTASRHIRTILTFQLNIPADVIIKKAYINFKITTNTAVATTIGIFIGYIKDASKLHCQDLASPTNLEFIEPVIWSIVLWEQSAVTSDISSLIEYAVHSDWFHGKSINIIFFPAGPYEGNEINLSFLANEAHLNVYYSNQKPNNFLHVLPDETDVYTSYTANVFRISHNAFSFWLYMSGENFGTLFVWLIHSSFQSPQIIFRSNSSRTGNWNEINVPISSEPNTPYKIEFNVLYKKGLYGHVAIDRVKMHNGSVKTDSGFVPVHDLGDTTSYVDVTKKLGYPIPLLLYPFATEEHYLKNYGSANESLRHLHSAPYEVSWIRDRYGMPLHAMKGFAGLQTIEFVFPEQFTILFHLQPTLLKLNETQCIFNAGLGGPKRFAVTLFGKKLGIWIQSEDGRNLYFYSKMLAKVNVWTYYAIIYTDAKLSLYYNNTLDASFNISGPYYDVFPSYLSYHYCLRSKETFYSGYISCFQLYDKVLNVAEIKAVEFCPNRQDTSYHHLQCKHGLSVAFDTKGCVCYDSGLRHQTEECHNAFSETVYKASLAYIPFDFKKASTDEKGDFLLDYQTSGNIVLQPGPMDYAACVNHNSSTIGSVEAPCSGDISTCTEGYVIGFWFYLAYRESETEWIKVFGFGDIAMNVKFSSNNASIHADADIKWLFQTCINTIFPINSWVYINIELLPTSFKMFLNGEHIVKNGPCQYPTGSNSNETILRIASHVCIDEFFVATTSNPPSVGTELFYTDYLFGGDYVNTVIITLDITSEDYEARNYTREEKKYINLSLHAMLKDYFVQFSATKFINSESMEIKSNGTMLHIPVLVSLSYLSFDIEDAFYKSPIQEHLYQGRKYCIQWNSTTSNIAVPSEINFTATVRSSTAITLHISSLGEEDRRYHHGFRVRLLESRTVDSLLSEIITLERFYHTGMLMFNVDNLGPFRNYYISLWSMTHQGYGTRAVQSVSLPADVNYVPPQNVLANNISHTSIKVKWDLYDNVSYWNSENMTFRIYWKKVEIDSSSISLYNLSSYDHKDVHATLKDFLIINYGAQAITTLAINNLEAFTNYSILVATVNDIGVGAFTDVFCRTAEWSPESAPEELHADQLVEDFVSLHWKFPDDIEIYNSWNLKGYNVTFEATWPGIPDVTVIVSNKQMSLNSSSMGYFNIYKASVSAYNKVGNGPINSVCFSLKEGVPTSEPKTLQLINATHDTLTFNIGNVSTKDEHGVIMYYTIQYKSLNWNDEIHNEVSPNLTHSHANMQFWNEMSMFRISCTMLEMKQPRSSGIINYTLHNLYPYTQYEVRAAACTKVNCSSHFVTKIFLTNETFPCAPNISMWNTSSSEMLVSIDSFEQLCLNGLLKYYHMVMLDSVLYADIIENLSLENIPTQHMENLTVTSYTATQLKKYWNYTAVVYIENRFGNGPFSLKWAFTAEDAPDGPPTNISGYGNSSTSIVLNVSLPLLEVRNGIIRGYEVHLYNLDKFQPEEKTFNIGDEKASILFLTKLTKFTKYEIKVRAFTTVGSGPYSAVFIIETLEDVPSAPPAHFNVTSITESTVDVNWENVPKQFRHGIFISFILHLRGILENGTLQYLTHNITYNMLVSHYKDIFSGLFPFTMYNMSIQGCTTPGCGVKKFTSIQTNEMVPSGVIQHFQQQNLEMKESLFFSWSDILPMEKRGNIVNFSIIYDKYEKPWEASDDTTVSFHVSGDQFFASILNLKNFTSYHVEIFGVTKIGNGPTVAVDLQTAENVPLLFPEITYANNISSSAINIKFTKLLPSSWQGEPLGYYIYRQYADEQTNCTPGFVCSKMEYTKCYGADIEGCDVVGLDLHTNYSVCVAGFTNAGPGPMSKCMHVITDTFVDGNWTEWSGWGHCDRSCANGTEVRLRFCINPIPARGGANCSGSNVDKRPCNDFPCPGFYLAKPLMDCTETCNNLGDNKFGCSNVIDTSNMTRVFETSIDGYDYTSVDGTSCSTDDSKKIYSEEYHPAFLVHETVCAGYTRVPGRIKCSVDGVLSETYRRLCYCIDKESLGYTEWGYWSPCSKSCATGVSRRIRICLLEKDCNKTEDNKDCNTELCPIHGSWGIWSEFGECSKTCGFGIRTRQRYCNSPAPLFGGTDCVGTDVDNMPGCNPNPCPINGGWSDWTPLEFCSQPCGVGGTQLQRRYCNNPEPLYGGLTCQDFPVYHTPCNEDILCEGVDVNFVVTLTNETWHYTMHYATSEKGSKIHKDIKRKVMILMEESPVDATIINDIVVHQLSRGSVVANFSVFYLQNSFSETLVLQNAIEEIGFINDIPVQRISVSSDNVPEKAPAFKAVSEESDKIKISWEDDTAWDTSTLPGDFYLYYIFYRDLTNRNINWTSVGTLNKTIELIDLKANTLYGIRLIVALVTANGIASPEKKLRTKQGVPLISPPNFDYREMSASSIYLTWDEIPKKDIPGTLLGYKIVYKRLDNNLTLSTTTAADTLQRTINDLKPATYYFFEINGYTVTGYGPLSFFTLETSYDAPGVAPPNVTWEDRISSHHINIAWRPIPKDQENGYVVGYKIRYILIRRSDKDEPPADTPEEKEVDRFTFSITIDNLSAYAEYKFEVFAFAKEGDGPIYTFTAETCKCPENIYTNYYSMKPYINKGKSGLKHIEGFFPQFLSQILRGVCTKCKAYNQPNLYFDRTYTGHPAEKVSVNKMKESVGDTVQLNMPIYGKFEVTKFAGVYPYIGIVRTQGSAAIMYDHKVKVVSLKQLFNKMAAMWTLMLLMVLLSMACGWFIWFAEQTSSNSDFAIQNAFKGACQGMWMAVITMSTVGYGDYTPSSKASQALMMVWTLMGLVVTSVFVASISTSMTSSNVQQEVNLYGTLVAAIPGTVEYNLAVLRNAQVYNVSEPSDVLMAVNKNIVQIGLLDALVATSYENQLQELSLTVKKIYDTNSGYGTVLSGGLESIEEDFRSYVDANRGSINAFVSNQIKVLQPNVTIVETSFLPKSELIDYIILMCYIFAGLYLLASAVWLCCLKNRRNMKIQPIATREDMIKTELVPSMKEFLEHFVIVVEKLEQKHFSELSRLQVLRTNFIRLLTRNGHTEEEVRKKLDTIRIKQVKKIKRKQRKLKYLESITYNGANP